MRLSVAAAVLLVLASALAAAAAPVGGGTFDVRRFKPRSGRTFVPVGVEVHVLFSRPVDPATVTAQNVFLRELVGAPVDATYRTEKGGRAVVITPVRSLRPGTDYQAVVRQGLRSADGRPLRRERRAAFFTDPRGLPFHVLLPEQFEKLASLMSEGRAGHSATTLPGGDVLLAGGQSDFTSYCVGGDLFDPETAEFRATGGRLAVPRAFHPAVRFGSGVLLVGGSGANGALSSTEVWPGGTWAPGPRLAEERDFVAAVTLRDGRVLVTGGLRYLPGGGAAYSDTAEIYDPAQGRFRFTKGNPVARRAGHSLTLLPDGRVFVVGGQSGGTSTPPVAEVFDPATETFTALPAGPSYHRQLHSATVIDALGRVLLADGGTALLEMFDPTAGSFFPAGGASSVSRNGATASLLPDGSVLLAGGLEVRGTSSVALDAMDLWVPGGGDHGQVLRVTVMLPEPLYGHAAATLRDGRVLYTGGYATGTATDSLRSAVLFTPDGLPAPAKR